jgi:hypothetical protein
MACPQGFGLHDVGVERRTGSNGIDAAIQAVPIGVDQQLQAEAISGVVAERDHLAKFPRRIDMQQREGERGGIKCLHGEMQQYARILADRIEHHRFFELGDGLAHDRDRFRLELHKMRRHCLGHVAVNVARRIDSPATAKSTTCKLLEFAGSPGWIRTSDHSINSRMLYR